MFKHILIPTDGSAVAAKAVRAGISLAAEVGARVTACCNQEPAPVHLYGGGHLSDKRVVAQFERRAREHAERSVKSAQQAARAAGVAFEALITNHPVAYKGIVDAAKKRNCDAIFMASHGRRGLSGLILGSVTQKVLAHSKVPVLVFR
jgi:nucleotide-binding universal stress UspA family protein